MNAHARSRPKTPDNVLANRTIVSFNSIDCTSQHPRVVNTAVSQPCLLLITSVVLCSFGKRYIINEFYVLIYRCGDTNGLICLSMALAWLFLMTPNMDTRSMKTSWPCPCKLPAQNEQAQQYLSNTSTDRSIKCYVLTNITILFDRLRAPKAPDANADMGSHNFTYALMPHTGWLIFLNLKIMNFQTTMNNTNACEKASFRMLRLSSTPTTWTSRSTPYMASLLIPGVHSL